MMVPNNWVAPLMPSSPTWRRSSKWRTSIDPTTTDSRQRSQRATFTASVWSLATLTRMPWTWLAPTGISGQAMASRDAIACPEIPVGANHVQGMRVSVASDHTEAVKVARCERCLESVVVGSIDVLHLEDLRQVGELGIKGATQLFGTIIVGGIHLVDVPDADES